MRSKLRRGGAVVFAASVAFAIPSAQAALDYTQTVESKPGLLAYYQFSNSTSSSVNGYTGTLSSGASIDAAGSGPALADDPTNRALKLDGTTGNELLSSLHSGVSTAGSIVGWVNLGTLPSTAGRFFYVAGESASGDDFDLQFQTDNKLYFYTEGGGNVSAPAFTQSNVGQWVFVAATFTANSDRNLYINGALVATNTPNGHADSGNDFTIGYSNVFGNRAFQGGIDEVAFYNTDLTASQISDIYASAAIPAPEPTSLALASVIGLGLIHRRVRR